MIETGEKLDKIQKRGGASRILNASEDKEQLNGINERLAQMSQRATYQILVSKTLQV